jgi:stage V sporulation protein SpoVS
MASSTRYRAVVPVKALGNQAVRQAIRQVHTGRTTRRKSVVNRNQSQAQAALRIDGDGR